MQLKATPEMFVLGNCYMFIVTTEPGNQPGQFNTSWIFCTFLKKLYFTIKIIYGGMWEAILLTEGDTRDEDDILFYFS